MSENKQPGKYDAVIGKQPQTPMYGAVVGGIQGLKQRFESVEDVSEKAKILEEALQYEEKGKKFIIDVFKSENKENLIAEILLRNPSYSELIINIIFEQQPATILKVGAIKIWNEFREKNIKFIPNLTGANLSNVCLFNTDLSGANLSGADLSSANLKDTNLSSANLFFANLFFADLSGANLSHANLTSSDLTCANLSNANLRSANLRSVDLRSADLSNTNLCGANLESANLNYAKFHSALIDTETIINNKYKKQILKVCIFKETEQTSN